ncbi:tyrosine-type recombinase/integrase, partial [Dialister succinatiphilus]|uniref:tyrosine-type recombinase/integrase n=1 Tax=Dialister succinatiphilus TaxID=487173 RepID=UPI004027EAF4
MEDIDAQKVKEYLDILAAEGKAKKTAINARSVISCVFEYWCNYMHGTGNPVRNAHIPKKMPVTERQEPTKEQRQLIEAHPEGCGFWAALFEYTGMRMGEANGLRWKDIDFAAGKITPEQAMPWDKNHP